MTLDSTVDFNHESPRFRVVNDHSVTLFKELELSRYIDAMIGRFIHLEICLILLTFPVIVLTGFDPV